MLGGCLQSLGALENVDALGSLTDVGGYVSIKVCQRAQPGVQPPPFTWRLAVLIVLFFVP